ncbi:MAG: endonuclease/exonuclease/phosphatase family metal-dependent hydrolase, partial [Hyphomicrobiaceae bacterium]
MVRSLVLLLLTLASHVASPLTAQAAPRPATDTVRVMSFNIRYWNTRDGENRWELRRHRVAGILRLQRADIFGVQEAVAKQVRYLHDELKDHDSFGEPRDGVHGGERCTIFWDRTKLDRIGGATFWLSETPERLSRAWGASLRRICTWCEFRSKASNKTFYVFNTHFDHQSANARKRSAELVRQQIHDIAGTHPVVLMGDLNCNGFSPPYTALTAPPSGPKAPGALLDARVWTEHDVGPLGTWSGWDPTFTGSRIDYLFVKNAARVLQHA